MASLKGLNPPTGKVPPPTEAGTVVCCLLGSISIVTKTEKFAWRLRKEKTESEKTEKRVCRENGKGVNFEFGLNQVK